MKCVPKQSTRCQPAASYSMARSARHLAAVLGRMHKGSVTVILLPLISSSSI